MNISIIKFFILILCPDKTAMAVQVNSLIHSLLVFRLILMIAILTICYSYLYGAPYTDPCLIGQSEKVILVSATG